MMMRAFLLLALLTGVAHADRQRLVITGSSTVAPLVLDIAKRFEALNPGTRIDVQTGGSSRGINDVRQGLADIGMVSRALRPDETDLQATVIAGDGIALIVHASNPLRNLTRDDVRAIYRGARRDWRSLGGPDLPITVVSKAEGRSTLELFTQFFSLRNRDIRASVIIGDNQQGIKTVAGNPGSIGYVSIGAAEHEVSAGTAIKLLQLDGQTASVAAVKSGRFPLARPLNLVVRGKPTPLASRFLDFARSPQVVDLVKDQYFVPITR